jgi:hypothetical protein
MKVSVAFHQPPRRATLYARWTQADEDGTFGMTVWINDGSESGDLLKSSPAMDKMWCGGSDSPGQTVTSIN